MEKMFIKSLELNNFRQYKGKQKIEFSTDPDRNVTLLLGDNTSGKTTILQAFIWCLTNTANFDKKHDLLNYVVQEEMIEQKRDSDYVSVVLEVVQDEMEYTITRRQTYRRLNGEVRSAQNSELTVQYKTPEGNLKSIRDSEVNNKVKELYPEELINYFFYDSERVRRIAERKDITKAVRQLLGMTVLENILENIGKTTVKNTVLSRLFSELSVKSKEEANSAKEKAELAELELKRIAEQEDQKESEIKNYHREIEKIQDLIRGSESGAEIQRNRDRVKKEHEKAIANEKRFKEQFYKKFKRQPYNFFISALKVRVLDQLEEAKFEDSGIKDMNTDSIDALIERGVCVCGTKIEEGSEHLAHLLKEKNNLPPESITLLVSKYKNHLESMGVRSEEYVEDLGNYYSHLFEAIETKEEKEEELIALEERLLANQKTIDLERRNRDYQLKIDSLNEELRRLNQEKGRQETVLTENRTKYQNLASANDKNYEIRVQIAYAEALKLRIQENYDEREGNLKQELEDSINEAFQKIYHGNRTVKIDNRYNVELYTTTNSGEEIITDRSEGLETVTNFAFVLGLISLAQEKHLDEEAENDTYPLVLDAPFSNTDQVHVEKISKVLPEASDQLILIVMEKDWNHARDVISPRIGKSYRLEKKSEIETYVVEEEQV